MSYRCLKAIAKSDYTKLVPILVLAFYLAFIPHKDYPYLVHLDEWVHMASSNQILDQATVADLTNPFSGGAKMFTQYAEVGFHLFWAVFQQISGISWLDIFRYFPAIIFTFTVLAVYVLTRRLGFGWEAAFATCLIPTTVGILGPGFLVPVAMGLFFIAVAMFIVFNFQTLWSYVVLFVLVLFLVSVHAATAVGLGVILLPYIIMNLKGSFKHSLGVSLALVIPFLIPSFWTLGALVPNAKAIFSPQEIASYIQVPNIIRTYGYLPALLSLLGTLLLALRGGKKYYGLALGLAAMLVMLATFYTFHHGVAMMYYRGLLYLMLMLGITAGAGLMGIRKLKLPDSFARRLKNTRLSGSAGPVLCALVIAAVLAVAIPSRQDIPYYHMIDEEDYQAFVWVKKNLDTTYQKAVLDPWKGAAFTAIAGKEVYTFIGEYPTATDQKAYEFLSSGCSDTDFLRKNGITIVYTRSDCDNPDLTEVQKNIYLLREVKPSE